MDIEIVNTILRLCTEQQTCLFEVPFLCDYCLEQKLCTNSKHVLASIKNYLEIFKISRDQNRIEFFMPFEICRNNFIDGICQNNGEICSNIHVCYDYFYTNSCRRSINCPYPHKLTEKLHKNILGTLSNLDLDVLTKAFRVYCQSKKHLLNHNSTRGQTQSIPSSSLINNPTPSSSITTNWRMINTPQINGNSSWKTNSQPIITPRTLPIQQSVTQIPDKGLQICWTPQKDIQTHFIEVVFSNQGKSDGGPMRTHHIYQHLGIAQVFYQNSDIADRVVLHGPVTFQSFTFTPRLLQHTADMRHVCFSNMPIETNRIPSYIDTVSKPYRISHFEYYQNDKQIIVVEYNEDIDFSKIFSNVRNHPECDGLMINCIQLYQPETLLIEYDQDYSEDDIKNLFEEDRIFHLKMYSYCSFVHFYSHDDLARSVENIFDDSIRMTPIYIDIYSQQHLNDYLQRRLIKLKPKPSITPSLPIVNGTSKKEPVSSPIRKIDSPSKPQPSIPILPPPPIDKLTEIPPEPASPIKEKTCSPTPSKSVKKQEEILLNSNTEPIIEEANAKSIVNSDDDDKENETVTSEDDFHDLPSEFEDDDLFLDESIDNNGDMEFLRSAAKNLISSLAEMEAASTNSNTIDAPHSLLYGDDYVVTIKSRRFALAFLDYTQFRVEKQRNPDRFRLLASLNKITNNKKRLNHAQQNDQTLAPIHPDLLLTNETKSNKKKRNKRNKKKKNTNDKDDEIQLTNE